MPSTPRGRDAAAICAVILTILLAFAWMRSSDGGVPTVPAGLSVEMAPATMPEEPAGAAPPATGLEEETASDEQAPRKAKRTRPDRAAKHENADRADAGEDARAPVHHRGARGWAGTDRRDPPAATPAPSAGSGGGDVPPSQAPEFALG